MRIILELLQNEPPKVLGFSNEDNSLIDDLKSFGLEYNDTNVNINIRGSDIRIGNLAIININLEGIKDDKK